MNNYVTAHSRFYSRAIAHLHIMESVYKLFINHLGLLFDYYQLPNAVIVKPLLLIGLQQLFINDCIITTSELAKFNSPCHDQIR